MPNNASQQHKQYINKDYSLYNSPAEQVRKQHKQRFKEMFTGEDYFLCCFDCVPELQEKGVGERWDQTLKYDKGIALHVVVRNLNLDSP